MIDGASGLTLYWRIIIPWLLPVIQAVAVIAIMPYILLWAFDVRNFPSSFSASFTTSHPFTLPLYLPTTVVMCFFILSMRTSRETSFPRLSVKNHLGA